MNRHPPHCLHTEVVSQFGLLTGAHVYKDINASNAPSLKIPRCSQQIIRLLFLRAPRYYASLAMVYVRSNVRSIGIHPDRLVGQSLVTSPPFSLVIGTRPSVRGRLSMVSISTLPPRREFPFTLHIGDVVYAPLAGKPAYIVNSNEIAERLLGKGNLCSGRPYSRMVNSL